jgi:hypothetical protein
VDSGRADGVTIEQVEQHIESGDLFDWLNKEFKGHIDLSIYRGRPSANEISQGLQEILGGYAGRERRKWGVENNGICLLVAWVNELIQQRAWKDDQERAA